MATIFSKIIGGEIPGQIVYRDDVCAAFLDLEPLTQGHALVVPLVEVDQWTDLQPETINHLMQTAARIGRAQLQAFGGQRVGIIIQGFEVPHAHIHVFPTSGPADFDFARKQHRSPELLADDAGALQAALAADQG